MPKKEAFVSFDLSSTQDLTAVGVSVMLGRKIFVDCRTFCVRDRINSQDNPKRKEYAQWENEGVLTVIDEPVIDHGVIFNHIKDLTRMFKVVGVYYDGWYGGNLALQLDRNGIKTTKVPQTTRILSPMMRQFEDAVARNQIVHNGNPILRWQLSNIIVAPDNNGNIFPRKPNDESKIDAGVSVIMSTAYALESMVNQKAPVASSVKHGAERRGK